MCIRDRDCREREANMGSVMAQLVRDKSLLQSELDCMQRELLSTNAEMDEMSDQMMWLESQSRGELTSHKGDLEAASLFHDLITSPESDKPTALADSAATLTDTPKSARARRSRATPCTLGAAAGEPGPLSEARAADREYFLMTVTALNLMGMEDGETMCSPEQQEQLWEDVKQHAVPFHMWHPWLHARMQLDKALSSSDSDSEQEEECVVIAQPAKQRVVGVGSWQTRIKNKVKTLLRQPVEPGCTEHEPQPTEHAIPEESQSKAVTLLRAVRAQHVDGVAAVIQSLGSMAAVLVVNTRGYDGMCALHLAAEAGNLQICQQLLDAQAAVNAPHNTNQRTPLHVAAAVGQVKATQLLLHNQAAADARDSQGRTACHLAALGNHGQVFQLLVRLGADIMATDKNGQIAFDLVTNMTRFQLSCSALSDESHPNHQEMVHEMARAPQTGCNPRSSR
eukprot:TRINITY_DN11883_c0_g1_i4.p1 TRINITY_DN11883_c0_g1~~TRINITY_DN11883_c0_g1_i4.p1  ORF type:complete len:453 (-),score=109.22 TRINITY_DN11883_c0_g1_i4:227-1585(-)